jgi:hypothetical protein
MSPEARANEYYLDPVSGLRNERAFVASPGGRQVAVITTPDAKGINDHPTAGGHDVTNDLLRTIGAAIGDGHEEAARAGTNFLLHVKDRAELDQVLERVRAKLGNDKLHIVGELAGSKKGAFDALRASTDAARAANELPARGALHPQLDVAGLKFPEGKAAGKVPQDLVDQIGALSDEEYAKKAYLDRVTVDGKPLDTGLLSAEGWNAIPRKAHVASIDLRGLKAANERFGEETGNKMLFAFAEIVGPLRRVELRRGAPLRRRVRVPAQRPAAARAFVKRVKTQLGRVEFDRCRSGQWQGRTRHRRLPAWHRTQLRRRRQSPQRRKATRSRSGVCGSRTG